MPAIVRIRRRVAMLVACVCVYVRSLEPSEMFSVDAAIAHFSIDAELPSHRQGVQKGGQIWGPRH